MRDYLRLYLYAFEEKLCIKLQQNTSGKKRLFLLRGLKGRDFFFFLDFIYLLLKEIFK